MESDLLAGVVDPPHVVVIDLLRFVDKMVPCLYIYKPSICHVYCRAARGEMVFSDPLEAFEFVETVADVKRLYEFLKKSWKPGLRLSSLRTVALPVFCCPLQNSTC